LPALLEDRVYVGISAGSAVATPGLNYDPGHLERTGVYYDDEYGEAAPPGAGSARGMGLVDFVLRPHLNAEYFPAATMEMMERAAAKVDAPLYAIDDQTAIKVVDGKAEVVSEGEWRLFER
jgi:dipeptidase E